MNRNREQEYKMIGLNIAYYRKLKGMTQLQLAESAGISRTHMSNIEAPNMPTSISLDTLMDLADLQAIDLHYKNSSNCNICCFRQLTNFSGVRRNATDTFFCAVLPHLHSNIKIYSPLSGYVTFHTVQGCADDGA